jgi:hypothetical protein
LFCYIIRVMLQAQVDEIMTAAAQSVSESPMETVESSEEDIPCGQTTPTRSPIHSDSDESCTPSSVTPDRHGNILISPRQAAMTPPNRRRVGKSHSAPPSAVKMAARANYSIGDLEGYKLWQTKLPVSIFKK